MRDEAERYALIHSVLSGARGLTGCDLDDHLAASCGTDAGLRAEVDELLADGADDGKNDALVNGNIERARSSLEAMMDLSTAAWLPERIGSYVIARQIGQGGMGIVYEATQESPRRSVAIKLLHPIDATSERLARFRREAELLGRLQHPGIAQIFEAGTYDLGRGPQPFIAMELVQGENIRDYCDQGELDRSARIELLARVADAVQYAHEREVIHRDLKPENILVDAGGRPRILDFGIAHASGHSGTLSTIVTGTGQLVGTLTYMAPEQLQQSRDALTPQADVYALGVLAFELLVGRLPSEVGDLPISQAIAVLASSEPARAGLLDPSLAGDVETILGKALAHERGRRYASAAALAEDLRRHLTHRPILARPPSRTYLVRKFTRRHRALVGGALATLVVGILGSLVAGRFSVEAKQRSAQLSRAGYLSGITAAHHAVQQRDWAGAGALLDRVPAAHRGWENEFLRARLVHHTDEWELPTPLLTALAFGPDGQRMFGVLADGSIGTWDASSGRLLQRVRIDGLRLDPKRAATDLALHGPSLRFAALRDDGDITIGDMHGGSLTRIRTGTRWNDVRIFGWDSSGERLVYVTAIGADDLREDVAHVWGEGESVDLAGEFVEQATLDREGGRLALAYEHTVWLLDVETGVQLGQRTFKDLIRNLAFSPDDERLAIGCFYRSIHLLDGHSLEVVASLAGQPNGVADLAWDASGTRLVSAGVEGALLVWDMETLEASAEYHVGMPSAELMSVTPDGAYAVVAGDRIRRFPLGDPHVLRGSPSYVYDLAFSPDGSLLASSAHRTPEILVWDVEHATLHRRLPAPQTYRSPYIAFSEDGARLVTGSKSGTMHWDVQTGGALPVAPLENSVARYFVTLGRALWGPDGNQVFSPDGRRIVRCHDSGQVTVHEVPPGLRDGEPPLAEHRSFPRHVARIDTPALGRLVGHTGETYCAAFSPDGSRIATGGNDGTVRIWDSRTYEQLLVLRGHEQYVKCVAFSPDGTLLASGSGDATIRLWDTKTLVERRE